MVNNLSMTSTKISWPSGVIGSRTGLKILYQKWCMGSSPILATRKEIIIPKLHLKGFDEDVRRILSDKYRISWRKAMQVFGYERIKEFERAGNMPCFVAEAINYTVNDYNKRMKEQNGKNSG